MNKLQSILNKQKAVILDGATSTLLGDRGNDISGKLWSARVIYENPEAVTQVHLDYYLAGADVATTISYQATIEGFMDAGFGKAESIIYLQDAVTLAKKARDIFWADEQNHVNRESPLVAASIGAYGAYLTDGSEYRGNYGISDADLKAFHEERFALLYDAAPDIMACETIPCLQEALVLAEIAKEQNALCWISFSCKDALHISDGTPIVECAKALEAYEQVAAIGLNCTAPEYVESLVKELQPVTKKPILVYPNSGRVYDAENKVWLGAKDGLTYAERAVQWNNAGARLIGGCCETTTEDISGVRKAILG